MNEIRDVVYDIIEEFEKTELTEEDWNRVTVVEEENNAFDFSGTAFAIIAALSIPAILGFTGFGKNW